MRKNLLNKNTWLIYYCLIVISTILLFSNIDNKYNELLSIAKSEQFYITKIVKEDIESLLTTFDTMIDLVSEDFNEDNNLNQTILSNILNKSNLLMGFVIFNVDGSVQDKSDNLPLQLNAANSNSYFKKILKSQLKKDKLIIGRPMFSPFTHKWIIPIKKALFNNSGEFTGYMSSAIFLEKLKKKWPRSQALGNSLMLTLDNRFYRILNTGVAVSDYQEFYQQPVRLSQIAKVEAELNKQSLSLEKLRISGEVAQINIKLHGQEKLLSLAYSKKYQFWAHSNRPHNDVLTPLLHAAIYYLILYIIFLIVTFYLFKKVNKLEESKLMELTYKSEHDELTGCYNRTVLKRLTRSLKRKQKPFSLLYIDLDNFKNINESFGQRFGDVLLQEVSARIKQSLTTITGNLVRYSGDEFILLVEDNDPKNVCNFTKQLLNDLAKLHNIENNSFSVTASIGIARYPFDSKTLDKLISYAENSMEIAKKAKNHYLFFSKEVHQQLLKQAKIEQALYHAIDNDEISILYQPQMDSNKRLYGVEALARWHSAELGPIPPDQFISIAENIGLMPKLGLYIMNKAMKEISDLQTKSARHFSLSINVSVRQFVQVDFFDLLIQSIKDYGNENLPITIEITESLFIESLEVLLPVFLKMKEHNISLALDDFGTGYSSLSMLKNIPIDELKIDKSFVDHITDHQMDKAMGESIVNIGKNLDMRVLAEGIETKAQLEILKESGCDLFQGYYFSKPLNLLDLEAFMQHYC